MAKTSTINEIKNIVANTECKVEKFRDWSGSYTAESHTAETEQGSYHFTGSREEFIKRAQKALRQENYSPARDKATQASISKRQDVLVWLRNNLQLWKVIEAAHAVMVPLMEKYHKAQQELRALRCSDWKKAVAADKVADKICKDMKDEVRKIAVKLSLKYDGSVLLLNGHRVSVDYFYQTMPENWKRMAQQAA